MYWQKRFDKENSDQNLEEIILEIRTNHKNFGYRRIYGVLRKQGLVVNKKRVQRIMQKLGLQVTSFTRKSRKYSSYKGKVGKVASNRIHRRFKTPIPHQKITTDTTEFKYYEVDEKGWAYQMKVYVHTLKANKIFQSMSRKENCHDNAVMENFFGIMKQEMYYGEVYYGYEELKVAIEKYIKDYNEHRIKEKLGWMSPVEYRLSLLAA